MYVYVDRQCAHLAPGARFLVAAMREWVAATQAGRCSCRALAPGFGAAGAGDVLPHFQMMMAVLNRDGLRALRFGGRCRTTVVEDEAVLLGLLDRAGAGLSCLGAAEALVAPVMAPVLVRALCAVAAGLLATPAANRGADRRTSEDDR